MDDEAADAADATGAAVATAATGAAARDVERLAVLADAVRRGLYEHVRSADHPLTRDEAAAAAGISRALAAFHLDKLVGAGLCEAVRVRPPSRVGAGRRAKAYRPSGAAVRVSVPPRHTDLLTAILIDTIEAIDGVAPPDARSTAADAARARGRAVGEQEATARRLRRPGAERTLAAAGAALTRLGFEPAPAPDGSLWLRNCPFHPHAERDPALVCGLNVAFVDGLLRGLGNDTVAAVLEPRAGACCVTLRPR